jgi:hypothetical protein
MAFKIKDGLRIGTADVFNNTGHLTNVKIADSSGGETYNLVVSNITENRDITLPLLGGNDTFVFAAHTQTLTNKTLTLPTIGATGANFDGSTSGTITVLAAAAAGTNTITLPAATGTVALTGDKLSAFAATTSAELAGVISDETGSGKLVFGTSPTLTTSLVTDSSSFDLINTTATTVNFAGAATTLSIGAGTGSTTINNGLTVAGNLIVNGTTTTVNSTTTTLDDPVLTLGGDTAPTTDDSKDRGIEFRWWDAADVGSEAKLGFFGFDKSTGKFTFIPKATESGEAYSGTTGEIDAKIDWTNILNVPATASANSIGSIVVDDTDGAGDDPAEYTWSATGTLTAADPGDSITFVSGDGIDVDVDTTGLAIRFTNTDDLEAVTGRGASTPNAITITDETDGTSGSEGALIVAGGIGVNKSVFVNGDIVNGDSGTPIAHTKGKTFAISTTSATAVDSFAVATFRSAEFLVQVTQGTTYQVSKVFVLHNGTTTFMTEYAVLENDGALVTFTTDISGGNVRLLATMGAADAATIRIQRTAMAI